MSVYCKGNRKVNFISWYPTLKPKALVIPKMSYNRGNTVSGNHRAGVINIRSFARSPRILSANLNDVIHRVTDCALETLGPVFLICGLTLIPVWKWNYIHYKVWDKIIYPSPNLNCATVEVWECIINVIPQFIGHVIIYPCCDLNQTILVKGHQIAESTKECILTL